MSNQIFLVVLDAAGGIIAVADPSKAPQGMAYSIASSKQHSVHEVHAPGDTMKQAHAEMKRVIQERISAGACQPHRSRRVKYY